MGSLVADLPPTTTLPCGGCPEGLTALTFLLETAKLTMAEGMHCKESRAGEHPAGHGFNPSPAVTAMPDGIIPAMLANKCWESLDAGDPRH